MVDIRGACESDFDTVTSEDTIVRRDEPTSGKILWGERSQLESHHLDEDFPLAGVVQLNKEDALVGA